MAVATFLSRTPIRAAADAFDAADEQVGFIVGKRSRIPGGWNVPKQLQGLIWKDGFHSGQLVSHLFDDVAPAIRTWNEEGLDVRIYSSGSVAAQKLFFGHTVAGDLLALLKGHYDTKTGPKKERDSYIAIAKEFGLPPNEILFISDVSAELEAAKAAGMQVLLSLRPGNHPVDDRDRFSTISSFDQVNLVSNS